MVRAWDRREQGRCPVCGQETQLGEGGTAATLEGHCDACYGLLSGAGGPDYQRFD